MSAEDKSFIESLKDLVDSGVISANISIDSGAEISGYRTSRYSNDVAIEEGANELNTLTTSTPMSMSLRSAPMLMSLDSLNDEGTIVDNEGNRWEIDKVHYPWYDCYNDESYSYIDSNKNIIIDNG